MLFRCEDFDIIHNYWAIYLFGYYSFDIVNLLLVFLKQALTRVILGVMVKV